MANPLQRSLLRLAFACLAILYLGCDSKPVGTVTKVEGTVTLDDTPLVKVRVEFIPEDLTLGVGGSSGTTDSQGHYTLLVNDGRPGALVGKHKVTFHTERDDARSKTPGSPRPVPPKYTKADAENPYASIEVTAEKKSYDFDLKSN